MVYHQVFKYFQMLDYLKVYHLCRKLQFQIRKDLQRPYDGHYTGILLIPPLLALCMEKCNLSKNVGLLIIIKILGHKVTLFGMQ